MKILHIDLTAGTVAVEQADALAPVGLGGKALALTLLERDLDPTADALSPDNLVVITPSRLAAYGFSGADRFGVFARSPLTGAILETYSGGTGGRTLSEVGWDAITLRGAADEPVRLHIDAQGASILPAGELWGKDVFTVTDTLDAQLPKRSVALVIGPAGENLVTIASVQAEKHHSLGRGGLGAVFGSKRLKAVTVTSPGPERPQSLPAFDAVRRNVSKQATDSPVATKYRGLGTPMMVAVLNEVGGFPAAYWSQGTVPFRSTLEAENFPEWATVATDTCPPCPMRCRRRITITEGSESGRVVHGPEYETLYSFGGLCEIQHARDVLLLHELCNVLGMDTISAGNLVALAMEAGRAGTLAEAPQAGDAAATGALLESIARRDTELGDTLAAGIRAAAARLGLSDRAIHVKGMEPAGYDPRALDGMGLAYATSPRGACHLRTTFYKPILAGMTKDKDAAGVVDLFVDFEDRLFLFDCLIMCRFYRDFLTWDDLAVVVSELAGREVGGGELQQVTAQLLTRVRRLNFAFGLTAADDDLPRRFFDEPLGSKPAVDEAAFREQLRLYFEKRGWGAEGVPPERAAAETRR